MTRKSEAERTEAIARLREILRPGDTVYCIIKHVSRSGMSREIELYAISEADESCPRPHPVYLTGYAATALGWRRGDRGVKVGGFGMGMDMCFHTVYQLAHAVFRDSPDTDGPKPFASRRDQGEHETNRGYWLRSETL